MRPPLPLRALLAGLAAALVACAPTPDRAGPDVGLSLEECRLPGVADALRCGTWNVPEDPDRPDGRRLDLKVVVAPARDRPVAPDPIYFLAGGPGQGATEVLPQVLGFLRRSRKHRDLVFVDQRGTGGSHKLACEAPADDLTARLEFATDPQELADCLASLDADPTLYTTPRFVADLDAVRAALGHEQVNLYGGSYGTRAGLAYMQAHPDRVRSAALDGLAPYAMKLFTTFGADGKAALDRLFADCAAEAPCAEAFGDLGDRLLPWLDGLAAREEPLRATLRDPRTGAPVPGVVVERTAVASAIRGLLYSTDYASLLPFAIHRALDGDLQPLLGQALLLGEGSERSMAVGLMLSVACAEDLPRITDAERDALTAEPFLGAAMVDMMRDACASWPVGPVPASLFEPVAADVPTLLLSGAEDPVTPERWATEAARSLPRATLVTLPATGHIAAAGGCGDKLLRDFYRDPDRPLKVDRTCLTDVKRPPFFLRATGPNP